MINETKVIEPQTLESSWDIKWSEKIETIYPEVLEVPTYDYGASQNQLDYNIALRNKPTSWAQYYCWLVQRSSWATWSQSITGVGFTPKYISYILFWRYWTNWTTQSEWFANSATNTVYKQCDYTGWTSNWVNWTWTNPVMAHIRTAWGAYIEPHLVSFDSDWFTINWDYISQNADIIYTCYG